MDELDRAIVNHLQRGFPLSEQPFLEAAAKLGIDERELLARLQGLLERNVLTRFGPLYDAERLGGAFSLCAMSVPAADFERVAALVNAHPEVAHNYQREHRFNMWFVLATTSPCGIAQLVGRIERETGYPVLDLPREAEFFVGLRLIA
jgi:DNA-binding Lrp family transcriptional regulator